MSDATKNPFKELWKLGDTLVYLGVDMVVVGFTDEADADWIHERQQWNPFYENYIHALKFF